MPGYMLEYSRSGENAFVGPYSLYGKILTFDGDDYFVNIFIAGEDRNIRVDNVSGKAGKLNGWYDDIPVLSD
jgi:hypothetical protein